MGRIIAAIASLAVATSLLGPAGCTKSPPVESDSPSTPKVGLPKTLQWWEVHMLEGKRIGYGHTTGRHDTEAGRHVVLTESLNHLAVKRAGQTTEQDIRGKSVETPEGRLLRFESEIRMGPNPVRTVGRVLGDQLVLETTGSGSPTPTQNSIPWSADCRGPFAVEQTLLRKPMQPGERRTFNSLLIGFNQLAYVELVAKDFEPAALLSGPHDLLRVETTTRLPDGHSIAGTIWADRTGRTLKTRTMGLETYRTSKAEALAKAGDAELDLLTSTMIKVDRPLPDAHQTKQIRYRVHLEGGDPASVFVTGPSQAVKSIDAETAEITVYAIRPGRSDGNPNAPSDPPTEADRRPNRFIQSDDATIVADAEKATDGQTDPWRVATALQQFVYRTVEEKNYTEAFATAAEVAQTHEGDCTEHAVFLAALARARGIPARVAIGLVYMPKVDAFGYHMWTQVYVEDRWISIDGTLAQGGIGAAHLEIAHSDLQGASAYSALLPVVQVLGRLSIEIVDVQ